MSESSARESRNEASAAVHSGALDRDRVAYAATDAGAAHDLPPEEHRGAWTPWRKVLYPKIYLWFVLLAALDFICTWVILGVGGAEVNWIAALVIRYGDKVGTAVYKFGLAILIILVCEYVGRRRYKVGRRLATAAVLITAIPVTVAIAQMLIVVMRPHGPADH